jgi:hypothetical protein
MYIYEFHKYNTRGNLLLHIQKSPRASCIVNVTSSWIQVILKEGDNVTMSTLQILRMATSSWKINIGTANSQNSWTSFSQVLSSLIWNKNTNTRGLVEREWDTESEHGHVNMYILDDHKNKPKVTYCWTSEKVVKHLLSSMSHHHEINKFYQVEIMSEFLP